MSLSLQQARLSRDPRFDGRFFVGVKTTGIFCRPVCPARMPQEQNVEYFDFAHQAAASGYRPCLRCRPDSAPNSWAWKGKDTTLYRAIQLIKSQPGTRLAALAERLGIGERYLHKLFAEGTGIAPKQFQLFEQLLVAKQLLHGTSMSVEQVAQASGFSSSRRLQHHLKEHWRLTPTQIKRTNTSTTHPVEMTLAYRPPYQWQHVRDFWRLRAIKGMESIDELSYTRTISFKNVRGRMLMVHDPDKHQFTLQLDVNTLEHLPEILQRIRRLFDLDAEPSLIKHCLVAAGIEESDVLEGLRIPGVWDTFEAGCRAILGQQVSVKAAINLVTTLVHQLGDKVAEQYYFPTPAVVAEADLSFLRMPDSRRETLRRLAIYFAEQGDNEAGNEPEQWQELKGIGPWTVNYAKLRGLSEPDIWLDSDLVIRKQLANKRIDAGKCQPWRSYLTFQLWSMA